MKTNEEKAKMIAEQCKPCTKDFYDGIYQGVLISLNSESETVKKWDDLEKKISDFYVDENGNQRPDNYGDGLIGIGEAAASAFGFL